MKKELTELYPHLFEDNAFIIDSQSIQKIVSRTLSLSDFYYDSFLGEEEEHPTFENALKKALEVRYDDQIIENCRLDVSLMRQKAAINCYFGEVKVNSPEAVLMEKTINTLDAFESRYEMRHFTIHVLDNRPCLKMRYEIPLGWVEDVLVKWKGEITSVVRVGEELLVMMHSIERLPNSDTRILMHNPEVLGNEWAYEQIAHELVAGTIVNSIAWETFKLGPDNVRFQRVTLHSMEERRQQWQVDTMKLLEQLLKKACTPSKI